MTDKEIQDIMYEAIDRIEKGTGQRLVSFDYNFDKGTGGISLRDKEAKKGSKPPKEDKTVDKNACCVDCESTIAVIRDLLRDHERRIKRLELKVYTSRV